MGKITSAQRRRTANWASARPDPVLTARMTALLDELYAQLRLERAQARHGDAAEIRRRARIEREIERLMSDA